jgi:hypothetical protein
MFDIIDINVEDKLLLYIQNPNKSKARFVLVENYVNKNIWSHIFSLGK